MHIMVFELLFCHKYYHGFL